MLYIIYGDTVIKRYIRIVFIALCGVLYFFVALLSGVARFLSIICLLSIIIGFATFVDHSMPELRIALWAGLLPLPFLIAFQYLHYVLAKRFERPRVTYIVTRV
ncbi:hypothetical protein CQ054_22520 [Ochrobactrum sp. MYb29]|nr:hypothetical protein CQ054_22520 [Ochrobactrum sp. MYb29]